MYDTNIELSVDLLRTPTGEIVSDLISRQEDHGAVTRHNLAG